MATRPDITPELCRQHLDYDPETGKLFWKPRGREFFTADQYWAIWNGKFSGTEAFKAKDRRGYHYGRFFGRMVFSHRAAWAIVHGEWPDQIDHINGKRWDNRIVNIRSVSGQENMRNRRRYKNSVTDVPGVFQDRRSGSWRARLANIDLGSFETRCEAVAARRGAEKVAGYHQNHWRTDA